ncbi:MAG: methionyl-tRNA formyltransferase [Arenicella sp.]|nr:methionyl-tRNA formyltransferase [Arenicella sp.]
MKIIFAGTPDFAVAALKALSSEHEIVAVFTQPDRKSGRGKKLTAPPVKQFALEIEVPVFQPSNLKDQVELIQSLNADIMVVVAYGMLLPQSILDIPPLGCLNIHASVLPQWRGAAPIQRAIEAGDSQTGVSIMRMELGLDTGPVFNTLTIDINKSDTSLSLHDSLSALGAKGICETLSALEIDPTIVPAPQDDTQSSYAKKIGKAEAELDWNRPACYLHQQLRAFIPWPVSQTRHNQTRLRIWQASALSEQPTAPPGTIVACSDLGVNVACSEGILRIEKLQRDGSKPMHYSDFRNGYSLAVGDRLSVGESLATDDSLGLADESGSRPLNKGENGNG